MAPRRWLQPRYLVLLGVLFNLAAALISAHYIGANNARIEHLRKQIELRATRIDGLWQQRQDLERKQEFLLLLIHQRGPGDAVTRYARAWLARREGKGNAQGPLDAARIIAVVGRARDELIDQINDTYLERLELERRIAPLEARNADLLSTALFLQLLGLILVLARDLAS